MDEKDILLKTIEGLNASVASLSAINKKQAVQNEKLQERIKELTAQVAWLNRQLFGRKAEKLPVYDPGMQDLFADEFASLQRKADEKRDEAVEKTEKESAGEKSWKRQNRKMIEDLPILETEVIKPDGVDLSLYRRIGEEVTRVVKHKPGMLYVDAWKTDACYGTTTWRKMSSGPSRWNERITSSAATTRRPSTCL